MQSKPCTIKVCLKDIEQAIEEIYSFLPQQRNFLEFQKDLKTRKAVERNIEIIGEAMSRILKADPCFPIEASRKIVDTRNRIIHGYDSVSEDMLWLIVMKYLPNLEEQVKRLLKTM
ncbi:antitoxin [Bacteroidia bacterium]|nr:antitoxin [Bacteroidia bacterium]